MEAKSIERALRNPRITAERIAILYEEYNRLIDSFEYFDDDEELLLKFYNHPNCPLWIKAQIDDYMECISNTDESDDFDDYLNRLEEDIHDPNDGDDANIDYDEENLHFEPSKGWINDD